MPSLPRCKAPSLHNKSHKLPRAAAGAIQRSFLRFCCASCRRSRRLQGMLQHEAGGPSTQGYRPETNDPAEVGGWLCLRGYAGRGTYCWLER